MDRKQTLPLALCLVAAGWAHATPLDDAPPTQSSRMEAASNIPPDLIAPEPVPDVEVEPPAAPPTVPPLQTGKTASNAPETFRWPGSSDVMPVRDSGGRVIFPRSSNPTIVCAPLRVCDIQLQAGEKVQGAPHIGDAVRWKISPAVSGVGAQAVTHLIVKPTEAGLDTNLIVPTDRGTYHLRLVSSAVHYVSSVAFEGAEDQDSVWQNLNGSAAAQDASGDRDMPTVAVNRLNFNYKIKVVKGKPSFKPLRAMDDGYHTYIAMNEELPQGEAPALIGLSRSGEEQMVNYRLKGNLYVVDGTVAKLALISGVGRNQERIELTRNPCRQRGWLGICWDPKE
jgi:type IV secretion system protein TrbG